MKDPAEAVLALVEGKYVFHVWLMYFTVLIYTLQNIVDTCSANVP